MHDAAAFSELIHTVDLGQPPAVGELREGSGGSSGFTLGEEGGQCGVQVLLAGRSLC